MSVIGKSRSFNVTSIASSTAATAAMSMSGSPRFSVPSSRRNSLRSVMLPISVTTIEMKSAGGATLTKQEDGSILASGANPDFDTRT